MGRTSSLAASHLAGSAGIFRHRPVYTTITLTYEWLGAIPSRARCLRKPTEFTIEIGDGETSSDEQAKRRVEEVEQGLTEVPLERARRVTVARNKEPIVETSRTFLSGNFIALANRPARESPNVAS